MNKIKNILTLFCFFTILCAHISLFAQSATIQFSRSVAGGKAEGATKEWMLMKSGGGAVFLSLLYKQKQPINKPKVYVFIDKQNHLGDFLEYRTKRINAVPSHEWASDTLCFKEDGRYLISVANADKEIMASDTLMVRYDREVLFCESVGRNFLPEREGNEYAPNPYGLYYYNVYMRSAEPFDTHQLRTKIYRYDVGDYRTLISDSFDYVKPEWVATYYRGPFLKPGQYKFEVTKANGEPFAVNHVLLKAYSEEEHKE